MCGIAGIVSLGSVIKSPEPIDIDSFATYITGENNDLLYFLKKVKELKKIFLFYTLFENKEHQEEIKRAILKLSERIETEEEQEQSELLKDIKWTLSSELIENIKKIEKFESNDSLSLPQLEIFKNINAVLNSIDRLEVRGRDSAGISLLFVFEKEEFEKFVVDLSENEKKELGQRKKRSLVNRTISIGKNNKYVSIAFTYKVAAEIGSLGDNIKFLRKEIAEDTIFRKSTKFSHKYHTISSHTRWASVGSINEENCHPADSLLSDSDSGNEIIHVCLNGDIDNYRNLKKELKENHKIKSDTKVIPLIIKKYIKEGFELKEAFRLAVNDFSGSHAISMHTDLAPGKLFLAQKGSGQAIFVGLADDHYMPASEVYGFVEETSAFVKMNGEKIVKTEKGETSGQIFILDQNSKGNIESIDAFYYDGTAISLTKEDIKYTNITARDIDRQEFSHYFLKEISESPESVRKTISNRWKTGEKGLKYVTLDEKTFPHHLEEAFKKDEIKRIFLVGQGTAGVAAACCANILKYYLHNSPLQIEAIKASELSGFVLFDHDKPDALKNTLVIAITQSGTTTDTNKTVDMVKERGGYTLAIVNRRDSDITFKVDGVFYTSTGRDIEMSVASTKAFYSQVTAGALLGLYIASFKKKMTVDFDLFTDKEINRLCSIPLAMEKILSMQEEIKKSAEKLALTKTYWAVVGSGANKAAADEIRIKLSELCYKTISSDYIEDKKHIDLSAEPLIILCAAGARKNVIKDIVKDTAIFSAHKATVVAIADEKEKRFAPYAEDIFNIPTISQHFEPVLNTLVGHIWGYFAALAINDVSKYLYEFKEDIKKRVEDFAKEGLDAYEAVLEESFREKIALFSIGLKQKKADRRLPSIIGFKTASDLTLILKYLSGKLPVSDFEFDFNVKGTARNMLDLLFKILGDAVNCTARPVDAIKHQAKTVTVGTSRISDKIGGIVFEKLWHCNIKLSQLTTNNVLVLKNLQGIIADIKGYILYGIENMSVTGKPTDNTTINIVDKGGILESIPSRVEKDNILRGTKKTIIVRGNVYIAQARRDRRNILVIPVISSTPEFPNRIERILLLNFTFKEDVDRSVKIKALGEKFGFIKNIVQESIEEWKNEYIDMVPLHTLFGQSAEKTGELIVSILSFSG